ncbi:MAG TPA: hypothetical protein V6C57_21800 [Coleofasciculaceae cyanobacterium]
MSFASPYSILNSFSIAHPLHPFPGSIGNSNVSSIASLTVRLT